ncbi:MAG: hypothetical protein ABI811_09220 [Acidobacteriota bacterium]
MQRDFTKELTLYKQTITARLGVGRHDRIKQEAEWTVRWQKGESIVQIANAVDIGTQADPEQAIYRAIQRFAKGIGLTLRKKGERPPPSKTVLKK